MKELQAGIQFVRTKCIGQNRHCVHHKKTLKPKAVKALPPQISDRQKPLVSFPISSPLHVLQQRTVEGLRRLKNQELRINQLSVELEAAMLEFKVIASEINQDWKGFQAAREPKSAIADICEYQVVNLPNVQQKPSGAFV